MQLGFDGLPVDPSALPAPAATHRESFRERESRLLSEGQHPSGIGVLATGDHAGAGKRCKDCLFCVKQDGVAGDYHKCRLMRAYWTGGRATDILVKWPACRKFQAKG